MDDDFDDFEPFADKDFDDDTRGARAPKARGNARKQAAWQRLEEHKDVRRLREELEDWEDWDNFDAS